jgi:hypothetical protein
MLESFMIGDGKEIIDMKFLEEDYMIVSTAEPGIYVCPFTNG